MIIVSKNGIKTIICLEKRTETQVGFVLFDFFIVIFIQLVGKTTKAIDFFLRLRNC